MEITSSLINFGFLLVILIGINGWLNSGTDTYPAVMINSGLNIDTYSGNFTSQVAKDAGDTATQGTLTDSGTGSDWFTGTSIWLKNLAALPTWSTTFMNFNTNILTTLQIPDEMIRLTAGIITFIFLLAVFAAFLRWKA